MPVRRHDQIYMLSGAISGPMQVRLEPGNSYRRMEPSFSPKAGIDKDTLPSQCQTTKMLLVIWITGSMKCCLQHQEQVQLQRRS